jgi:F-type H+-transporting ATPase subunit b
MQIDWVTTGAQIANFVVLLWLLQRFLYRPILKAVDRREAEISKRLDVAAAAVEDAKKQSDILQQERTNLANERQSILNAAREEADQLRETLREEVNLEIEADHLNMKKGLEAERRAFAKEIAGVAVHRVSVLAEKVLGDLADTSLERQIVSTFLEELAGLSKVKQRRLIDRIEKDGAIISSSRALTRADKQRLQRALAKLSDTQFETKFQTDASLQAGLRLQIGGHIQEWSVDKYLRDFEANMNAALNYDGAKSGVNNSATGKQDHGQ